MAHVGIAYTTPSPCAISMDPPALPHPMSAAEGEPSPARSPTGRTWRISARRAVSPQQSFERPHPSFLRWHREYASSSSEQCDHARGLRSCTACLRLAPHGRFPTVKKLASSWKSCSSSCPSKLKILKAASWDGKGCARNLSCNMLILHSQNRPYVGFESSGNMCSP